VFTVYKAKWTPDFEELEKIPQPNHSNDQFLPVNNVVFITCKFIIQFILGVICVVIRSKCVEVSVQSGSPDLPLPIMGQN